eukprot:2696432-Heterocapsa_arctica.AAC.1
MRCSAVTAGGAKTGGRLANHLCNCSLLQAASASEAVRARFALRAASAAACGVQAAGRATARPIGKLSSTAPACSTPKISSG